MKYVRYRTGLVLDGMYCSFCGARRTGRVFQENARWMVQMRECGHIGFRGWVLPPDELEKRGLVNPKTAPDPRIESRRKETERENMLRAKEDIERKLREGRIKELRMTEDEARKLVRTWTPA